MRSRVLQAGYDAGFAAAKDVDWDPKEESLESAAWEAEENARQFSPFEHLASDINRREDSDELWEVYERGVGSGIADGVLERVGE